MDNTFSLLLKKEFTDNKKPLLLGACGIWGMFILLGGFIGKVTGSVGTEIVLFVFISGLIMAIGSSLAFSNMKTKEGRINVLMLPASATDKFFVRWIGTVPMLLIVLAIGFIVGDLARLGLAYSEGNPTVNMFDWFKAERIDWGDCFFIWGLMLVMQSFYFLGSILWPKYSFIKTLAVLQILLILLGFVLVFCVRNVHFSDPVTVEFLSWAIFGGSVLICVAVYALSYLRFRRSQVVNKLF